MRRKNATPCFRKLKSVFWRFGAKKIFLRKASSGAMEENHLYFMKGRRPRTASPAYIMLRHGYLKISFCATKPCAGIMYRVAPDGIPMVYPLKLRQKKY